MKQAKMAAALGICCLLASCGSNQGYLPAQSGESTQQTTGQQQGGDQTQSDNSGQVLQPMQYQQTAPAKPAPSAPSGSTPSPGSSTGGGGRPSAS